LRVTVGRPDDLGARELAAWRRMQRSNRLLSSPFLSPEFTMAVGRVKPAARTAVLEDGSDAVGFFPHERGSFGIGRPIGAGVSDCQALVHGDVLEWNPQTLLEGCGLAVWEFDHLLADQVPFAPYHTAREESPVMDVSGGYDRYLSERWRASKIVRSTARKMERLERDGHSVRFEFDVREPRLLTMLMGWKSAQYRRTGRWDRFAKRWIARVVEDLFWTRSPGCSGTLSLLYIDEQPAAAHFGLRSEGVLACWFPAYDPRFAKHSPGLILHLRMAQEGASRGVSYLDLGKGMVEYKEALRNRDISIAEGWVERRSPVAVVRRVQRLPHRYVVGFVLSRPSLRRRTRDVLRGFGRIRSAM
jgi:CelD/BcsL family acetyltransferase involved in cellulose biosynthesis